MSLIGRFLSLFELPDEPQQAPQAPQNRITEREQLEIQAAIIVQRMGSDPATVAYMGDGLLKSLINDYIKENKTA